MVLTNRQYGYDELMLNSEFIHDDERTHRRCGHSIISDENINIACADIRHD